MNVKIIRRPGYVCNMANRRVPLVQGATLLIRRKVFRKVAFPDRNRGECVQFCRDSAAQGFRIYAGGPYHFLAIRNPRSRGHTWIVSDKKLLSRHARAIRVKNIKKFISRG